MYQPCGSVSPQEPCGIAIGPHPRCPLALNPNPVTIAGDENQNWKWACKWRRWWRGHRGAALKAQRGCLMIPWGNPTPSNSDQHDGIPIFVWGHWQFYFLVDRDSKNTVFEKNAACIMIISKANVWISFSLKQQARISITELLMVACQPSRKSTPISVDTWKLEVWIPNIKDWTRSWLHKTSSNIEPY